VGSKRLKKREGGRRGGWTWRGVCVGRDDGGGDARRGRGGGGWSPRY
jgi:hypothetical protein